MANEQKVPGGRGGNRHPLVFKVFVISWLMLTGEDYIASMHRAYKETLDKLAAERNRRKPYHHPSYHSFEVKILQLVQEGALEFADREQTSDSARVQHLEGKPVRRFYRLKR